MPEIEHLRKIAEDINKTNKKVNQALSIRKRILERIINACETLKVNPNDKKARDFLVNNLDREKKFLEIIRRGSKEGVKSLELTLKYLKDTEAQEGVKAATEAIILNLIDSMQFSQRKIKVIEKRIKLGERLEYRDYDNMHINKFLETLQEEEELDKEIAARLKGELNRIVPPFKALVEKLMVGGSAGVLAGMLSCVIGSRLEMLKALIKVENFGMPKELVNQTIEPIALIWMIIGAGVIFVAAFGYWDILMAEDEQKARKELSF